MARGCAAEDAEPGGVYSVVGKDEKDGTVRRLRRGDDFAALANDGGRAGDVVDALKLRGERESGASPVVGCAAPVVVPKRGEVSGRRK